MNETLLDRPLPASVEAEKAVLGAIFLDNSAFYACENLASEDFTLEVHRKIYAVMTELAEDKCPIDFVTVGEKMGRGDAVYVCSLTDGLPRVKNIEHHVNILLETSQRRRFIAALGSALEDAHDGNIGKLIAETDARILEIGQAGRKSKPKSTKEITPRLYANVERIQSLDESRSAIGYRTGMEALDKVIKGYHKGEFTLIAGSTGDGKSSIMKQGVLAQISDNIKTLVFSGEMTDEQLLLTMLAPVTRIKYRSLRDPRLMDMYERTELTSLRPIVDSWPLWIDDATGLSIREVCARARAYIRREGVEIVFLDHTGKYHGSGENHTLRVTNIAVSRAALAKDEKVPVIALHQLNRPEKGQKRRPRLGDLRDSGVMEQEAHAVVFVYRPIDKDDEFTGLDEIVIAKQRHGEVGVLRAEFDKDTLMFGSR